MPEDTCEELNCCPPGFTVPPLGGVLSLAGEDSVNSDPNIDNGELVLAEEAEWVRCSINSASPSTLFTNTNPPLVPQTVLDFQNVKVGYFAYAVAIAKTFTATLGSPTIVLNSSTGVSVGDIIELATDYFVYGTTVLSISSPNVTLSSNALVSTPVVSAPNIVEGELYRIKTIGDTDWTLYGAGSNTIGEQFVCTSAPGVGTGTVDVVTLISFRPTTGQVKIGGLPLIPTGTVVSSLTLTSLVLSNATLAPSVMNRIVVAFFPAELDPNVTDEDELFT